MTTELARPPLTSSDRTMRRSLPRTPGLAARWHITQVAASGSRHAAQIQGKPLARSRSDACTDFGGIAPPAARAVPLRQQRSSNS